MTRRSLAALPTFPILDALKTALHIGAAILFLLVTGVAIFGAGFLLFFCSL